MPNTGPETRGAVSCVCGSRCITPPGTFRGASKLALETVPVMTWMAVFPDRGLPLLVHTQWNWLITLPPKQHQMFKGAPAHSQYLLFPIDKVFLFTCLFSISRKMSLKLHWAHLQANTFTKDLRSTKNNKTYSNGSKHSLKGLCNLLQMVAVFARGSVGGASCKVRCGWATQPLEVRCWSRNNRDGNSSEKGDFIINTGALLDLPKGQTKKVLRAQQSTDRIAKEPAVWF